MDRIKSNYPWASVVTQSDQAKEIEKQELFEIVRKNINSSGMSIQIQRETLLAVRKLMQ